MDLEIIFSVAGIAAMIGWVALAFAPLVPKLAQLLAAVLIPLLLSVAYVALALVFMADNPGGYGSLADVMLLFTVPGSVLAGWLHYLAFDLFVGAWIVRMAPKESIPHLFVIPCLALTFLFGPAGLFLFYVVRGCLRMTRGGVADA